jgi:hypothetical protein
VVQVLATPRVPNVLKPWLKQSSREVYGSRVVIGGNRERSAAGRPRAFGGLKNSAVFPVPSDAFLGITLSGATRKRKEEKREEKKKRKGREKGTAYIIKQGICDVPFSFP